MSSKPKAEWEPKFAPRFDWRRNVVAGLLVGLILTAGGTMFHALSALQELQFKVAELESESASVKIAPESTERRGDSAAIAPRAVQVRSENSAATSGLAKASVSHVDPHKLEDIIRAKQRAYVRESRGEWKSQCFTDDDLTVFIRSNEPGQVVEELKRDNSFIDAVLAIKAMTPTERQELLEYCRRLSHPTWEQLGGVFKDGRGQTEAGQRAELLLAGAIVDYVKELCRLPEEGIRKLYT